LDVNERERESKGRRIFPAGASDKPLEYVDLQIKKFTSVSLARARASASALSNPRSVLKFQTYFTVMGWRGVSAAPMGDGGGGGIRAKICDYLWRGFRAS